MDKWEYLVYSEEVVMNDDQSEKYLDYLGIEGWELVSVIPGKLRCFFFKRKVVSQNSGE